MHDVAGGFEPGRRLAPTNASRTRPKGPSFVPHRAHVGQSAQPAAPKGHAGNRGHAQVQARGMQCPWQLRRHLPGRPTTPACPHSTACTCSLLSVPPVPHPTPHSCTQVQDREPAAGTDLRLVSGLLAWADCQPRQADTTSPCIGCLTLSSPDLTLPAFLAASRSMGTAGAATSCLGWMVPSATKPSYACLIAPSRPSNESGTAAPASFRAVFLACTGLHHNLLACGGCTTSTP